jgi:hypothetical protein
MRQPLAFDLDFTAYMSSDGIENDNYVFVQALVDDSTVCSSALETNSSYRNVSASSATRRLEGSLSYQVVRLLYSTPKPISRPGNVLTAANVALVRELETGLQCSHKYKSYCSKGSTGSCAAAASLAPVFFVGGQSAFNTCPPVAASMLDMPFEEVVDAIARASAGAGFLETSFSSIDPESTVMISHLVFRGEASKLIDYMTKDLLPEVLSGSKGGFRVSVWNQEISDYSILQALAGDSRLAAAGFLLVVSVVAWTTRSGLLTGAAFLCMLLSLPLSYWAYVCCLGVTRTPLLNFFGLFVVVGIGCDGVFLIINSYDEFHSDEDNQRRSLCCRRPSPRDVLLLSKVWSFFISLQKPFISHYEHNCHGHSFYFFSSSCCSSTLTPYPLCTGLQTSRQRAPCRDGHHSRQFFCQLSFSPACAA